MGCRPGFRTEQSKGRARRHTLQARTHPRMAQHALRHLTRPLRGPTRPKPPSSAQHSTNTLMGARTLCLPQPSLTSWDI